MSVTQQKEKHRHGQPIRQETHLGEHPLRETGQPHEDTGGQGEPLVVGDVGVDSPPHCRADVDVEGGGDEDRGGETEEEEQGEVVHHELGQTRRIKYLKAQVIFISRWRYLIRLDAALGLQTFLLVVLLVLLPGSDVDDNVVVPGGVETAGGLLVFENVLLAQTFSPVGLFIIHLEIGVGIKQKAIIADIIFSRALTQSCLFDSGLMF